MGKRLVFSVLSLGSAPLNELCPRASVALFNLDSDRVVATAAADASLWPSSLEMSNEILSPTADRDHEDAKQIATLMKEPHVVVEFPVELALNNACWLNA